MLALLKAAGEVLPPSKPLTGSERLTPMSHPLRAIRDTFRFEIPEFSNVVDSAQLAIHADRT